MGPGTLPSRRERPKVRPLNVFHGKVGRGLVGGDVGRHGPVTLLAVVERGEGGEICRRRGEIVAGPNSSISAIPIAGMNSSRRTAVRRRVERRGAGASLRRRGGPHRPKDRQARQTALHGDSRRLTVTHLSLPATLALEEIGRQVDSQPAASKTLVWRKMVTRRPRNADSLPHPRQSIAGFCSLLNERGGGISAPVARRRVARNRMSSCFSSGGSWWAAASISVNVFIYRT